MVRLKKKPTAVLREQPVTSALPFYWTQRTVKRSNSTALHRPNGVLYFLLQGRSFGVARAATMESAVR
jgi:hypothetical protein